jgi:hypothetical protein
VIGALQCRNLDQVRQRVEPSFGFALRSFPGDMSSNVWASAMVPS